MTQPIRNFEQVFFSFDKVFACEVCFYTQVSVSQQPLFMLTIDRQAETSLPRAPIAICNSCNSTINFVRRDVEQKNIDNRTIVSLIGSRAEYIFYSPGGVGFTSQEVLNRYNNKLFGINNNNDPALKTPLRPSISSQVNSGNLIPVSNELFANNVDKKKSNFAKKILEAHYNTGQKFSMSRFGSIQNNERFAPFHQRTNLNHEKRPQPQVNSILATQLNKPISAPLPANIFKGSADVTFANHQKNITISHSVSNLINPSNTETTKKLRISEESEIEKNEGSITRESKETKDSDDVEVWIDVTEVKPDITQLDKEH